MEAQREGATVAPPVAERSSGRRIVFKVLAGVFAAGALGGLFGVAVVIAWVDTADGGVHRVHDMGFGALYGAILTPAFLAQLARPERQVSSMWCIATVALATVIAGALALSDLGLLGLFVAIALAVLLLLHPDRAGVLRPARDRLSLTLSGLTAAAAIPYVWYAVDMAALQRNGVPGDPHVDEAHWVAMSAMAIGIVLVGALSSARPPGWRVSAWSAGAASALYGLICVVYPEWPGSVGAGWGAAAIAWGLAFIAATEWESRRTTSGATLPTG